LTLTPVLHLFAFCESNYWGSKVSSTTQLGKSSEDFTFGTTVKIFCFCIRKTLFTIVIFQQVAPIKGFPLSIFPRQILYISSGTADIIGIQSKDLTLAPVLKLFAFCAATFCLRSLGFSSPHSYIPKILLVFWLFSKLSLTFPCQVPLSYILNTTFCLKCNFLFLHYGHAAKIFTLSLFV